MYRYLGISLEKMLTLDMLRGAKILAGFKGITKRVTKVNVMEVPDIIDWVSEGEFLLTTAYSIKDDINILLDLIPKLNEKCVSGLGVKVGRYVSELPESVIKLADELNFPIIEVPFCVSHTDVISCILTEVINDQMNMMIKIDDFNREVMNIMIKGGSLKQIAQKLYDNIGNSLAIYENIYDSSEVICDIEHRKDIDKIIQHHISLNSMEESNNFQDVSFKLYKDIIGEITIERVAIPIIIENVEYGCVFIWLDKKPLSHLDNMLIKSYMHIIALDFVKKLSLVNMESNYKLEFFDDLLSDDEKRQERALERAKNFNFHKELKYTSIVILFKDLYSGNKLIPGKVNFAQELISRSLFVVNRISKPNKDKIIYVDKSDRILILYGCACTKEEQIIKKEVMDFCRNIFDEILKKHEEIKLNIGIGRAYEEVELLWKSHKQAKLIVENLSNKYEGSIIYYDDLGVYRILAFDGLQQELYEFCNDTIRPLIEYDKANNSELVKTLKAYFQYDGNMKKISEKMYVHYNTIIYRLQKIKDITDLDLENCDSRLNLQIALKAVELMH